MPSLKRNQSPIPLWIKQLSFVVLIVTACYANTSYGAEVKVAVASNFLSTLKGLSALYMQDSADKILISTGSSGKLYAQVTHGAPYDLFLAADQHYPQLLIEQQKADKQSRYRYAQGILVLWSATKKSIDSQSLQDVDVRHIALANPKLAPYGIAAKQTLQQLGIADLLQKKLVRGESVAQAFQFVVTKNAQLGFVSAAQLLMLSESEKPTHHWVVPETLYDPLYQELVLLNKGRNNPAALRFVEFIKSDIAQQYIAASGYR